MDDYMSELQALATSFSVQMHCHTNLLQSPKAIGQVVLLFFWFVVKKRESGFESHEGQIVCVVCVVVCINKKLLQSLPMICLPSILAYNEKFARSMFIAIRISFNHGSGSAFLQSRLTMRTLLGGDEQLTELLLWHNGPVVGGPSGGANTSNNAGKDFTTACEPTVIVSSGASTASGSVEGTMQPVPHHETIHVLTTEELFRTSIPLLSQYTSFVPYRLPISPHSPYTPFVPYRPPSELDQPQFLLSPFTSIAAAGPSTICSTDVEGIAAAAPKLHSFLNYCWVPKAIVEQKSICTPAVAGKSVQLSGWNVGGPSGVSSTSSKARKDFTTACEPMMMASPDASTATGSIEGTTSLVPHKPTLSKAEGKRREREFHENDCQNNDDDDLRLGDVQKKSRKTTTLKRGRAAEVHNLSERGRRDKISTKLRALQELIPNSNKKDISSVLDEAIKYMKSLQLQVKILSMGKGGMVPVMYPGTQEQYIYSSSNGYRDGDDGNGHGHGGLEPINDAISNSTWRMPPFPMQQVLVPPTTARTPPGLNSLPMQQGPNQPQLSSLIRRWWIPINLILLLNNHNCQHGHLSRVKQLYVPALPFLAAA